MGIDASFYLAKHVAPVRPRRATRRPTSTFRRGWDRLAALFEGAPAPAQDRLDRDGRAPHLAALDRTHHRTTRLLAASGHDPGA